ncbi:MAG TPA: methyltransferase domain-containing protein [Micromonosporaceae bacterium]|nr:methyltransferase domain-containing protein [Micromonosporaceae bacterium]
MLAPEYSDDYTDPRLAIFYDQLNDWGPSDEFYLGRMMSASAVLDVGCGTGRLLHHAREAGHTGRLVGLDPASAMLDQAKVRTDVDWILGDLGTVALDHEFDLVIMTGHVFQVFLSDEDIATALTAVRSALATGGTFAFETLNPLRRPWERWTGGADVIAADGAIVTAENTNPHLVEPQIVEVTGRFSSPSWERDVLCPSKFRFIDVETLDAHLRDAGFVVVERFGDWDGQPYASDSLEIITVVERAPAQ